MVKKVRRAVGKYLMHRLSSRMMRKMGARMSLAATLGRPDGLGAFHGEILPMAWRMWSTVKMGAGKGGR
jgi:hypothetical protein